MKREDIYIGKIKKCRCLDGYKEYGDSRYVKDFSINKTEFGYIENNAYVVDDCAVLIRVNEYSFIWLRSVTSFIDEVKVNLGFSIDTIGIRPTMDGSLFVDFNSLVPYYHNDLNKSTTVKKLRMDTFRDSRIPGGIEY